MASTRDNWNLPAPPGFQGLREDLPLEVYEQLLPHWRQDGATYFVTFRLTDSLPQEKLDELRLFKEDWEAKLRARSVDISPRAVQGPRGLKSTLRVLEEREELTIEILRRVEHWLDQGMGQCWLKKPDLAKIVAETMIATDGSRCELGCFVVMPNHVHAVVRPLQPTADPLEKLLQTWKGSSACQINERLGQSGTLWQRDSFDRIIRDAEHIWRVVQYIGGNPSKAGLGATQALLWVRPEWVKLGWGFATDGVD
jgi:REP element-mobilizing transposase RayT